MAYLVELFVFKSLTPISFRAIRGRSPGGYETVGPASRLVLKNSNRREPTRQDNVDFFAERAAEESSPRYRF